MVVSSTNLELFSQLMTAATNAYVLMTARLLVLKWLACLFVNTTGSATNQETPSPLMTVATNACADQMEGWSVQ